MTILKLIENIVEKKKVNAYGFFFFDNCRRQMRNYLS